MRRARTRWGLVALGVAGILVAAIVAVAGEAASQSDPGGNLNASGTLTLQQGGTATFQLNMSESAQPGVGGTFFQLNGPGISVCDAHGPGMSPGDFPLTQYQCGGSGGVKVVVDRCRGTFETHGMTHADYPWTVYFGPMTVDVDFTYHPQKGTGTMRVDIHTQKAVIRLDGTVSGVIAMDTCT